MADPITNLPGEIWKPVVGYEGLYDVSNLGRVKSRDRLTKRRDHRRVVVPGRVMVTRARGNTPYIRVILRGGNGRSKTHAVHRLVLFAFCGAPKAGHSARHMDGNPENNALRNLAWATHSDNCRDKERHGTSQRGERNGRASMTDAQAAMVLRLYAMGEPLAVIAAKHNLRLHAVRALAGGRSWKHLAALAALEAK